MMPLKVMGSNKTNAEHLTKTIKKQLKNNYTEVKKRMSL